MPTLPAALRSLSLALLLAGLQQGPAAASILQPLDTAQLVQRAERIVLGTVESQDAHWLDEGHSSIVTDVRIRVSRGLRGAKEGEVITVRRLGGAVKDIGMRVFGEASYTVGEEVLLFSERRGEAYYSVGMTQGTMHVLSEGGQKLVHLDLQGAELLPRAGAPTAASATGAKRPLEDVLREVGALSQRLPSPAKSTPSAAPDRKVRP